MVRLQLSALTSEKRSGRREHRGMISLDCAVQYFINTLMKDTNYYEEVQLEVDTSFFPKLELLSTEAD